MEGTKRGREAPMVGAMRDEVVLFDGFDGMERVHTVCRCTGDGGLVIVQESAGELTRWCFGESPHRARARLAAWEVAALARQLGVDSAADVASALAIAVTGADALPRIRSVAQQLGDSENYFEKTA